MQLDSFHRCFNHTVLHIKALKESSFMSITQWGQKKNTEDLFSVSASLFLHRSDTKENRRGFLVVIRHVYL